MRFEPVQPSGSLTFSFSRAILNIIHKSLSIKQHITYNKQRKHGHLGRSRKLRQLALRSLIFFFVMFLHLQYILPFEPEKRALDLRRAIVGNIHQLFLPAIQGKEIQIDIDGSAYTPFFE